MVQKSQTTTWNVRNPVNNGIFTISTGAGYLPSTVSVLSMKIHQPYCQAMPGTFGLGRQFVADTQGAKETYSLGSYLRLGAVKGIVAEDVSYRCQLRRIVDVS